MRYSTITAKGRRTSSRARKANSGCRSRIAVVEKRAAPDEKSVAARAMDALHSLEIDTDTLESISKILKGYHT